MSPPGYTRAMAARPDPARLVLAALLCGVVLLGTGCITRHVRQDVFEQDRIQVFLRSDKRFLFSSVEKGYDHPETISAVRMAHILSRIDLRTAVKDGNRREPAIPTELLYPLAEGISEALAKADEDQEVVAMAIRRQKRLAILDDEYLTSLVAYVRADKLYIHLSKSDELQKETYRASAKLPQPRVGDEPSSFRLYGGTAMTLLNSNAVAVAWRDPIFKLPTRTKILPTGEVKRKTILLESPVEAESVEGEFEAESRARIPDGLSPEQLRALADLEEERRSGAITETEYRARQQQILAEPE